MNKGKSVAGLLLIGLAALLLLDSFHLFRVNWFAAITVPGILYMISFLFFAGYLSRGPSAAGMLVPAGILFTCGTVFLFGELLHAWAYVWPGFIAAPAVGLLLLYLFGTEHSPGLLVPIGVLSTVALTCLLSMVLNLWGILWPGFVLAPAVGLGMLYMTDRRNTGLLIPVFILGGIGVTSFFGMSAMMAATSSKFSLAGILILCGIILLTRRAHPKGAREHRGFRHGFGAGQGPTGAGFDGASNFGAGPDGRSRDDAQGNPYMNSDARNAYTAWSGPYDSDGNGPYGPNGSTGPYGAAGSNSAAGSNGANGENGMGGGAGSFGTRGGKANDDMTRYRGGSPDPRK